MYGQRIFVQEGTTDAVSSLPVGRGMVYLTGGMGVDLPDVGTGDRVSATNLTGVLAYQFGRYVLLVDDPAAIRSRMRQTSWMPRPPSGRNSSPSAP